jgi:hypothetical protein
MNGHKEKNMRYFSFALLAILIASALPSATLAQTSPSYTFKVPVTVNNTSAGAQVAVGCTLYSGANGTGNQYPATTPVQSATNGSQASFTLTMSPPSIFVGGKAASYDCYALVRNGSSNVQNNWTSVLGSTPAAGWTGLMTTGPTNLP